MMSDARRAKAFVQGPNDVQQFNGPSFTYIDVPIALDSID